MLTWNYLDIFFLQITYTLFRTFCFLKKLKIVLLKVWSACSVFKEAEEVFKATISDRQRFNIQALINELTGEHRGVWCRTFVAGGKGNRVRGVTRSRTVYRPQ